MSTTSGWPQRLRWRGLAWTVTEQEKHRNVARIDSRPTIFDLTSHRLHTTNHVLYQTIRLRRYWILNTPAVPEYPLLCTACNREKTKKQNHLRSTCVCPYKNVLLIVLNAGKVEEVNQTKILYFSLHRCFRPERRTGEPPVAISGIRTYNYDTCNRNTPVTCRQELPYDITCILTFIQYHIIYI